MEATAAAPFVDREGVFERLREGPGEEARQEAAPTPDGPPPSRWTLRTIRATLEEVRDYSLSGVWRWLRKRVGVNLRSATVQQFSPDPEYTPKLKRLKRCLREAARNPKKVVLLFLDEMGYWTCPEEATDWSLAPPAPAPVADRKQSSNGQWRIVGAMNALTGEVHYVDGYIVGRAKLIEMYGRIAEAYPKAKKIYVVQDNWSIHTHPEVLEAVTAYPQIQPIWLPTYAPWLNPIEKLRRWLKVDIVKLHRLADNWQKLRQRVNSFLDQFAQGSEALLKYVGLLGDGQLAQARQPP